MIDELEIIAFIPSYYDIVKESIFLEENFGLATTNDRRISWDITSEDRQYEDSFSISFYDYEHDTEYAYLRYEVFKVVPYDADIVRKFSFFAYVKVNKLMEKLEELLSKEEFTRTPL